MVEKIAEITLKRIKNLKWNKIFYMYYIEPIVFILVFAHSLSGTIMKNQVIYQACTNIFNYNETDCEQLGTKNVSDYINVIETEVQPYVANLFMIRTLLESIVPAICGIFIGSWSDHYGRKPLLLVSMIGFSFTYVITAIICELSRYYSVNPWYYILAVVPHSVLGGNCVFSVAAFCFISDVTDTKTRPYRMIFFEGFLFIGLMGGSLLSSFVYAATNATITFAISGVMMCVATAFIAVYVPESLNYKSKAELTKEATNDELEMANGGKTAGDKDEQTKGEHGDDIFIIGSFDKAAYLADKENENTDKYTKVEEGVKDPKDPKKNEAEKQTNPGENSTEERKNLGLFSYVHIKDMFATCTKERPYYDRGIIWLITGVMFLSIFVFDGAMTVFYLFAREKFHWTVRDFTFYETVSHMIPMFGAIIGFLILRKIFRMSVVSVALLAFFSDILSSVVRGVAAEDWHLYLAVAVGAFKSVGGPMCRTIVSNIVPPTDLGKIFSIKNVLQSIAPFLASPLYTLIYNQSLTTFPGLFNIVSAFLYLIAFIFLLVVLRLKFAYKDHYANILK